MDNSRLTCSTCIFFFPNSVAKLCERAFTPKLPAAKVLVTALPIVVVVVPVEMRVLLFQVGSSSSLLSLNEDRTMREWKGHSHIHLEESWNFWGIISRKDFQIPYLMLNIATQMVYSSFGIELHANMMSLCEYEERANDVACSLPKVGCNPNLKNRWFIGDLHGQLVHLFCLLSCPWVWLLWWQAWHFSHLKSHLDNNVQFKKKFGKGRIALYHDCPNPSVGSQLCWQYLSLVFCNWIEIWQSSHISNYQDLFCHL